MKNKLLLGALGLLLVTGLTFGATNTYAAAQNSSPFSTIIEKLAAKFGLKQEDIKEVFDEVRNERQAANEKKYEDFLTQAVKNGKLTEAQKQLLIAKHVEIQKNRAEKPANWQTMTKEERRSTMEKERTDLENWAKENNIDIKYLFGGFGFGRKGYGMGFKK